MVDKVWIVNNNVGTISEMEEIIAEEVRTITEEVEMMLHKDAAQEIIRKRVGIRKRDRDTTIEGLEVITYYAFRLCGYLMGIKSLKLTVYVCESGLYNRVLSIIDD
jgi:cysteine sulfinate desulfinase/cysteine desulfurase-like protein